MNIRRKFQEDQRKIERDKVSQMQYLKKMFDNDMKRQYNNFYSKNFYNQLPNKFMMNDIYKIL